MKGMIWLPSTLFLLVAAHLRRDLAADLKDLSLRYSTDTKNSTFVEVKASKLSDASDISNVQVSKIDFSNVSNVSNVSRIEDKSGLVAAEHDCSLPPGSRWCTLKAGKMNITMACYNDNDTVCGDVCATGFWEDGLLQPLREKQLPSYAGKVFLDVGMNVGVYSLVAASYGMKVVGFEAMPQNVALLHATFCSNPGLAKSISLHEVALSNRKTICSIVAGRANQGNGRIDCFSRSFKKKNKTGRGTVSVDMLNNFLAGMGQIAYAKFDIEGHECMMMKGGLDLLAPEHRPNYIQTEVSPKMEKWHGCSEAEYLKIFSDANYTIRGGLGNEKHDYLMVGSNYSFI